MKKLLLVLIALTAIWCASCKKTKEPDPTVLPDMNLVTLRFTPYNITPIRGDRGIEVVNRLDLWITDGEEMCDYHQVKNEASGFGTFYIALNRTKTYTIYAVGHKAEGEATLTDGIIAFPNDKVTHAMFYTTTFTPTSAMMLDCQMQRIVGMFKFTITDDLPGEVDHMQFNISESGTRFNTATMEAMNKIERVVIPGSMNPNNAGDYVFNIYIMSDDMENITDVDITVQAIDENEGIVEQRSFEEVPIKNGWVTSYVGEFFVSSQVTINFSVGDWSSFDDHPY